MATLDEFMQAISGKPAAASRSREFEHQQFNPNVFGADVLKEWLKGVKERTLHPLEALAKYSQDFQKMSPVDQGMQLTGGGLAGTIAGVGAKTANVAGIFDTAGLQNRGRELIQGKAEELAQRLRDAGVSVDIQHSGSKAGPSSYLRVVGMPDIRISGHSKGVFNSSGVLNVASQEEFDNVVNRAIQNQQQYNYQAAQMAMDYEDAAIPIRLKNADKKISKGKTLTKSEQEAVDLRAAKLGEAEQLSTQSLPYRQDAASRLGITNTASIADNTPKTQYELAHELAQRNAALPVEQGGLGLLANNTAMERAKAMGYQRADDGMDFMSEHRPPMSDSGAPLHDLTGGGNIYPDDVYSVNAARYYGTGDPTDNQLFRKIQSYKNKPEEKIRMFRAVPSDVMKSQGNTIHHGDWITPSRQYAVEHGESALGGDYRIQAGNFPAKSVFTNGDSPYEFGLDKSQYFADAPASVPLMRGTGFNSQDRSRFAAFDPLKRNSSDLLASLLPITTTGLLANQLRQSLLAEPQPD